MSNKSICLMIFIMMALIPFTVTAMSHQNHESTHQPEQGNHSGVPEQGRMFIVGDMTSKGVKGMAHLKEIRETMESHGQEATHHFMIAFVEEKSGEQIEKGRIALKLQDPDGKVTGPFELVGMQGHFGIDLTLSKEGEYHFKLGTQLGDKIKRKYHFHHKVNSSTMD